MEPIAMIAWLMSIPRDDFTFHDWLDTRRIPFPGEPNRTCDTVAYLDSLMDGGRAWAVIIEFQITPDAKMFGWLMVYGGHVWLELKPRKGKRDRFEVGAIIVNLTNKRLTARDMHWKSAKLRLQMDPIERNLSELQAATILSDIESGTAPMVILPWIPLMQGGCEPDIIEKWIQIAKSEPDRERRGDFGHLAKVFAGAVGCKEVWKSRLEEWNVVRSEVVDEWKAETVQKSIRSILKARFGSIPKSVEDALASITDLDVLESLVAPSAIAPDMKTFRSALPKAGE